MPVKKAFTVLMIMVLCLLPIKDSIAAPIIEKNLAQDEPPVSEISTGIAPTKDVNRSGISSLSGSILTFDPTVGGSACYDPGTPQTFCFRSETFTDSWEYVYNNWIKFPTDWTVSNVYVQGTPVCDGGGTWGAFSWSFQTSPYEVNVAHTRNQSQTDHCVATYCVDVTPAGVANEGETSWYFDGDGYGAAPHNPCSSDGYTPAGQNACDEIINPVAAVPICEVVPQVILEPEEIVTSGCHGEAQFHVITITNITGAEAIFDITYDKNFAGDFYGPDQITLADGATTDFDVFLDPHICADDGEYLAELSVSDGTYSDQTTIYYEVFSELVEWQQIPTNPVALMDNVLAGYNGKVWSIAGYGTLSDVSNYNPSLDIWTVIPASSPPWGAGSYPRSGCQVGNEVFLYGDSMNVYTGLWSYNMDTNLWTQETPGGTPPPYTGVWAPSWVADTDTGMCYMTGGATAAGGGNLATVFVYDVITNMWLTELPSFTNERDFHSAFLFTRPSDSHKLLCVAGGVDLANTEFSSTQCYDFSTGLWNAEDADLGALPVSLWGMGSSQRLTPDGEELWLVAGANNFIPTNQTWYYDVSSGAWMDGGSLDTIANYRTAAVNLNDKVYHVGGSAGSFNPTGNADKTVDTICPDCVVPGFTKQATEIALPGHNIHYTITVDPMVSDTAIFIDYIPEFVDYVPGSLSVSPDIGSYGYDADFNAIWWSYGSIMTKSSGWTPAQTSGITSPTAISTQSDVSTSITQTKSLDVSINSVLWDQPLSSVNQNAYVNQDFPDYPASSAFLADDFWVTSPWLIDTFFVPGNGWNGFTTLMNASTLTFLIYAEDAGMPAGDPSGGGALPVWSYTLPPADPQITITNGNSGYPSNTQLVLEEPILLPAGHYWFVFYPTLSFTTDGQFGRQPADTLNLNTAQFINPGGGFGYGTEWLPWTVLGGVLTQQDMAFRIEGAEIATLQIEFDATAKIPNLTIWNDAFLHYGDLVLSTSADTFTGYGTYLPMTIK
jgi:hypothetical protein